MSVGDLVQDWELGQIGVIVEVLTQTAVGDSDVPYYSVHYEDGDLGIAYENALELISD